MQDGYPSVNALLDVFAYAAVEIRMNHALISPCERAALLLGDS